MKSILDYRPFSVIQVQLKLLVLNLSVEDNVSYYPYEGSLQVQNRERIIWSQSSPQHIIIQLKRLL
jgi:hypothetical protein